MLLLSTLLLVLTTPVWTRPTPSYSLDPIAALKRDVRDPQATLEVDRDMDDIAHLAQAVNGAYCPHDIHLQDVVARSSAVRAEDVDVDENGDVSWHISYRPSTNTYTLAFSSPTPEDLLELLASVPISDSSDPQHLTPLPNSFLDSCPLHSGGGVGLGSIYSPYLPYLSTVTEATDALSKLIEQHRPSNSYLSSVLRSVVSTFGSRFFSPSTTPGRGSDLEPTVEITGHGLGAVLALLSSLRQSTLHPDLDIRVTFFSMPILGDLNFAQSVNQLVEERGGRLQLQRVSNGRDPLPVLPPPHFGLHHPTSITERYIEGSEGKERSGSWSRDRSRLDDSHGPYDGVMIGLRC